MITDFNAMAKNIEQLLEVEKAAQPVASLADLRERMAKRQEIQVLQKEFSEAVKQVGSGMSRLPRLAKLSLVEWANAVLEMPNLLFLVLDTTSLNNDADIIQIVVGGEHGMLWDTVIKPERQKGQTNHQYTGLEQADFDISPTLTEAWHLIQQALRGKYVLAYNLDFVELRLQENAAHYGMEPITLIGECLQTRVSEYFSNGGYPMKLTDACARIGHTISQYPTAQERMKAQLAVLRAMACAITSAPTPVASAATSELTFLHDKDDMGDLDDHPF